MKKIILLIIIYFSDSSQLNALSCMSPNIIKSYQYINIHSNKTVVILKGNFSESKLTWEKSKKLETRVINTNFKGFMLGKHGFEIPYSGPVGIVLECFADWCGSIQSKENIIAFVNIEEQKLKLRIQPCNSTIFSADISDNEQRLLKCHRFGEC